MKVYRVKQLPRREITVSVPASKSILNRALLLAAFAERPVFLKCGAFGEDTRALLGCLSALGIPAERRDGGLYVRGSGVPSKKKASLDVMSAGTAARFLPAVLAFCGGEYSFRSSEQMARRPMEVLPALQSLGVQIEYGGERERFPFLLRSEGIKKRGCTVDTEKSTQFASGLLLAAACGNVPFDLRLQGNRTEGSYIRMTLALMKEFGCAWERTENLIRVFPRRTPPPETYATEPDLSAACYFYALALLLGIRVTVRDVRLPSLQGDERFLRLLKARGVRFEDAPEGLCADGRGISSFAGFEEDMRDCSDQALTVAALAPFADSLTRITGIGHIRGQECDRIAAIEQNLASLGVPVSAEADAVTISPAQIEGGTIRTFRDHRVAMAFSLIGLRTGNVLIENPDCTAKTFEGYFDLLEDLCRD